MRFSVLTLLSLSLSFLNAADWYASPTGTASGDGSIGNPWNLWVALNATNSATAGDTIHLRGGTYNGPFASDISGTSENYITVTSYTGEWAIISDGGVGVLDASIDDTQTTLVVRGSELWPTMGFNIDGENINITTKGANLTNWTGVRGWSGSTNLAHSEGDIVTPVLATIEHTGNYVKFQNFEITGNSSTNRTRTFGHYIHAGIDLQSTGVGNKAINLIVHNTAHPGIGFWQQGSGGEVNGCLIFGTGQYDYIEGFSGTTRGSAIYSQNASGNAYIKNCITYRNFTTGGKVYGENGPVRDFLFQTNFAFDNGGDELESAAGNVLNPTTNIWFDGNIILGRPLLAFTSLTNTDQYFVNNIIVDGTFSTKEHRDSTYTNNTVFMPTNSGVGANTISYFSSKFTHAQMNLDWNRNFYYLGDGSSQYNWTFTSSTGATLNALGGGNLKFTNDSGHAWQDHSTFDADTFYQEDWPTDYQKIEIVNLEYDSNRWHICVVDMTGVTNVTVDLSTLGFSNGDQFKLIDVQNWPTVINSGTYSGGNINLALNLTNISDIPNMTHYDNEHTNVDQPGLFNVFMLDRILGGRQITQGKLNTTGKVAFQ